jgi:hypothetical protein
VNEWKATASSTHLILVVATKRPAEHVLGANIVVRLCDCSPQQAILGRRTVQCVRDLSEQDLMAGRTEERTKSRSSKGVPPVADRDAKQRTTAGPPRRCIHRATARPTTNVLKVTHVAFVSPVPTVSFDEHLDDAT